METVKKPWVAFKVLAAGALKPEIGFEFAFQNGADFIAVGMFDFQVEQDALAARTAMAHASSRKRPWIA